MAVYKNIEIEIPKSHVTIERQRDGRPALIKYVIEAPYDREKGYARPKRTTIGHQVAGSTTMMHPTTQFAEIFPSQWEKISSDDARTNGLPVEIRTDCAVAFCETIKNAGYTPAIYFNRNIGYYGYDLSRLTDYEFWFALPEAGYPSFYYAVDSWQYSFNEYVPGIETETDMNLLFLPVPEESPAPGKA